MNYLPLVKNQFNENIGYSHSPLVNIVAKAMMNTNVLNYLVTLQQLVIRGKRSDLQTVFDILPEVANQTNLVLAFLKTYFIPRVSSQRPSFAMGHEPNYTQELQTFELTSYGEMIEIDYSEVLNNPSILEEKIKMALECLHFTKQIKILQALMGNTGPNYFLPERQQEESHILNLISLRNEMVGCAQKGKKIFDRVIEKGCDKIRMNIFFKNETPNTINVLMTNNVARAIGNNEAKSFPGSNELSFPSKYENTLALPSSYEIKVIYDHHGDHELKREMPVHQEFTETHAVFGTYAQYDPRVLMNVDIKTLPDLSWKVFDAKKNDFGGEKELNMENRLRNSLRFGDDGKIGGEHMQSFIRSLKEDSFTKQNGGLVKYFGDFKNIHENFGFLKFMAKCWIENVIRPKGHNLPEKFNQVFSMLEKHAAGAVENPNFEMYRLGYDSTPNNIQLGAQGIVDNVDNNGLVFNPPPLANSQTGVNKGGYYTGYPMYVLVNKGGVMGYEEKEQMMLIDGLVDELVGCLFEDAFQDRYGKDFKKNVLCQMVVMGRLLWQEPQNANNRYNKYLENYDIYGDLPPVAGNNFAQYNAQNNNAFVKMTDTEAVIERFPFLQKLFEKNDDFKELLEMHPLERLIVLCILCSKVSIPVCVSLDKKKIPLPFEWRLVRCFQSWETEQVVMAPKGGQAGFMAVGFKSEIEAKNPYSHSVAVSMKELNCPVILYPERVFVQKDLLLTKYNKGLGLKIFPHTEESTEKLFEDYDGFIQMGFIGDFDQQISDHTAVSGSLQIEKGVYPKGEINCENGVTAFYNSVFHFEAHNSNCMPIFSNGNRENCEIFSDLITKETCYIGNLRIEGGITVYDDCSSDVRGMEKNHLIKFCKESNVLSGHHLTVRTTKN